MLALFGNNFFYSNLYSEELEEGSRKHGETVYSASRVDVRVVLSDVLGGKDVVEGRDGRMDVSDSYRTNSCKNGITCLDSFLHFTPR
jgi:hypothetical protein